MKIVGQSIQFDAECPVCHKDTLHVDGRCQECGAQNRDEDKIRLRVSITLEISGPDLIVLLHKLHEYQEGLEEMQRGKLPPITSRPPSVSLDVDAL